MISNTELKNYVFTKKFQFLFYKIVLYYIKERKIYNCIYIKMLIFFLLSHIRE